ncbi:hypothetical protein BOTBODRAFT_233637 [Botryobasidium botryosum FD-172 SS1]|uniref:Uncharacterized protein n=1 Tax=Botryobasidium botryosum (strain FD-172 SS1) TaxID=930990 RepID=A0A067LUU2_BOTB1|nr:hypothetical protein BOTBODRAFT_233637 [Botryobasidium botryosum FD-172 SS1]
MQKRLKFSQSTSQFQNMILTPSRWPSCGTHWGRGDGHFSYLCDTLDSEALAATLGPRQTAYPPTPLSEGSIFESSSPHDISPEDYAIPPDQEFALLDVAGIPYMRRLFSHSD